MGYGNYNSNSVGEDRRRIYSRVFSEVRRRLDRLWSYSSNSVGDDRRRIYSRVFSEVRRRLGRLWSYSSNSVRCEVDWANYGRAFRATDDRRSSVDWANYSSNSVGVGRRIYSRVFSEVRRRLREL